MEGKTVSQVLTAHKALGAVFATIFLLNKGPDILMTENMIPFLFTRISYSVPTAIVAVAGASLMALFVTGIISVASIIFFAGTIPVILVTDIDLSIKDLLLILVERIHLIILLSVLMGWVLL